MWRATVKGVLAYKLRLALTAIAVILGVAFVCGTFVLTDTLTGFFDEVFQEANAGTDVVIAPEQEASFGGAPGIIRTESVPTALLDRTRRTRGVEVAEGAVQGNAQILDKEGKPFGGLGPPTLGFSYPQRPEFSPLSVRGGEPPRGNDEAVIDVVSARRLGYKPGDRVRIVAAGPAREYTLSGVVGFGKADNLGGATLVAWELPVAQEVLGRTDGFDAIYLKAAPGVSIASLVDSLNDDLPEGFVARSSREAAADEAAQIKQGIQFFGTAILFFAGIALFVGAFIIANTFSIIVAQRSRELALLRSLGASRSQVLGSVLIEAALVGAVASVIGVGVGLLIGAGLRELVDAIGGGGGLPGASVGLRPRTVVVGLLVGTVTTVLSALVPAVRGSRQPPVVALQTSVMPAPARFSPRRVAVGLGAAAVAIALLARGLYGEDVPLRFGIIGLGALALFAGISLLSPLVARPMSRLLGAPVARAYGVTGRLARENAARHPQRTAATAAALMVGLALVAAVATMGASMSASINRLLDSAVRAQVVITNQRGGVIDPSVEGRVRSVEGVAAVVPLRVNEFRFRGKDRLLAATTAEGLESVVNLDVSEGSVDALRDGGVLVHEDVATKFGLRVGENMRMGFPRGSRDVRIDGIFRDRRVIDSSYILSLVDYEAGYGEQQDAVVFVATLSDASPAVVAARIREEIGRDYPQLEALDQEAFKQQSSQQIDQLLALVGALLMLSIIIALLGIANTLALSVFERTRELGLLRAVGMSRRQVRRMIRWESVIIAVLGSVLGVVVGLAFGWAIVRALRDEGITEFVVPAARVVTLVLLAGFAGMAAAIFPARRAARLDVLSAIAME